MVIFSPFNYDYGSGKELYLNQMKIAIIGTGGVGGYFGGKLAGTGSEVSFLARGEHLAALRKDGLSVNSYLGNFLIKPVMATDRFADLGKSDLIILGVKAWQIKEIVSELKVIMKPDSIILPLQNGILAAEELSGHINKSHIIGGLCRIMSRIASPGIIEHFGITPTIVFGEFDGTVSERTGKIKQIFDHAGIICRVSQDIESELWKKFIAICVSGLLAVTKSTYGEIREMNETRQLMIGLMEEIYTLSQKIGIKIEPDFIKNSVSFIDSAVPYDSTSSLTRDVLEGKPSEIEYQNGTVVRLGKQYGVPTPINEFIYHCLLPMERRARKN